MTTDGYGSRPRRALPGEQPRQPRRSRAAAVVVTAALVSLPLASAVPLTQPLSAVPAPRPPVVEPDRPDGVTDPPGRVADPRDRTGRTLPDPRPSADGEGPALGPGPSPAQPAPPAPPSTAPDVPASPERDLATLPDPSTEVTDLDLPAAALRAYRGAADTLARTDPSCRIDWALLAGIGRVESDHGRHGGSVVGADGSTSPEIIGVPLDGSAGVAAIRDTDGGRLDRDPVWDRAVGPMQFIPSTWAGIAADGDGDGGRDPHDLDDAALGAATYLCAGPGDLSTRAGAEAAVLRYNRSTEYVALVLGIAEAYRNGEVELPPVPPPPRADPPPGAGDPTDPGPSPAPDRSDPPAPDPSTPAEQNPSESPAPSPSGSATPDAPSPEPSAPSEDPSGTPTADPSDPDPSGSPDPSPSESADPDPPAPDPSGTPTTDPTGPGPSGPPDPDPSESMDPSESPDPGSSDPPSTDPSGSPTSEPSEPADPGPRGEQERSISGEVVDCQEGLCLDDGTPLDLGADADRRAAGSPHDYDGDGETETVGDELSGLVGRTVEVEGVVSSDGVLTVRTIDGHPYREEDGSWPAAPDDGPDD